MATRCERCGKRAHVSLTRAIRAALCNSKIWGSPYRIYRCPDGAGWHLTTQPAREDDHA